jgi:hypothetical protein
MSGGIGAESWSRPWHDLQRSLAAGFGATPAAAPGGGSFPIKGSTSPNGISPGSWLVKARTASGRGTGRPQNNCRITVR